MTEERIRTRLIRSVTDGGPATRELLETLAAHHGSRHPMATVAGLIEDGTFIKFGASRGTGARWGCKGHPGLPRPKPRRGVKVLRD